MTLEQLRQQKSIHFSRNPLIVRALADLGYVSEMGEGVPRMFKKWNTTGFIRRSFPPKVLFIVVRCATRRSTTKRRCAGSISSPTIKINLRQRRLLAYAYCHGKTFSTAEYERIAEVDRDTAYRDIRLMVKTGIVAPLKPKSRSYRIIEKL